MPIQLRYDLTTDPFPLQASDKTGNLSVAQLIVVASNPNTDPVKNTITLQGLIIQFPVGAGGTDLTLDATGIGPVPPPNWTLHDTQYPQGAVKYLFYPNPGHGDVGDKGLNFIFNNVQVNRETGSVEVDIVEGSNDCDPESDCPTKQIYVTKFPHGWGQVTFWTEPDPPIVPYQSGPTLHWAGPVGATYTIDYYTPQTGIVHVPQDGDPPLSNQGQYPGPHDALLQLEQNTTFYLKVVERIGGQSYSAQQEVTATVEAPRPEIASFTIAADRVSPGKALSFTMSWQLKNVRAFQITADDGPEGQYRTLPVPADATSYKVIPTQLVTTYTLYVLPQGTLTLAKGAPMQTDQIKAGDNPSAQVTAVINQLMPVGSIMPYGGNTLTLPPGWLLCDGSPFNQTQYPELYAALGNTNTLPDLRGYFLRGLDPTGKVDPNGAGRKLLSAQQDAFAKHSHVTQETPWFWNEATSGDNYIVGTNTTSGLHSQASSEVGDAETRSKNVAVYYLIFAGLPH